MNDLRLGIDIKGNNRDLLSSIAGSKTALASLRGEQSRMVASSKQAERQQRNLTRALNEQKRSLSALKLEWMGVRNAMFTLGIRTAVTGFASIVSILNSVVAGAGAAAASITMFGGALATVGTSGVAGFVQGLLVVKLAMNDVAKAFVATGDAKEKALGKLTSEARSFVAEIEKLGPTYQRFQKLAQIGLFPGVVQGIKNALPLLKVFERGVFNTAQTLGYLAERAGSVFGKRGADIGRFMERNLLTMRRMGDSAINLGDAFLHVQAAAEPLIGHITRGFVTFTKNLADAAEEARKDGSLASVFNEMRISWDNWTSNIGTFGKVLGNVLKAALPSAHRMEEAIGNTLEKWEEWTGSVKGQKFLREFFEDGLDVLGDVALLLGDVTELWVEFAGKGKNNARDFIDFLREDVLSTLDTVVNTLNEEIFPLFLDVSAKILEFAREIADSIRPWTPIIEAAAKAFGALATGVLALTDGVSGMAKLPMLIAGIAGIRLIWAKIAEAIALSTLRLRMFMGVAQEMPGFWGAAGARFGSSGGRISGGAAGNPGMGYAVRGRGGPGGGGTSAASSSPGASGLVDRRGAYYDRRDAYYGIPREGVGRVYNPTTGNQHGPVTRPLQSPRNLGVASFGIPGAFSMPGRQHQLSPGAAQMLNQPLPNVRQTAGDNLGRQVKRFNLDQQLGAAFASQSVQRGLKNQFGTALSSATRPFGRELNMMTRTAGKQMGNMAGTAMASTLGLGVAGARGVKGAFGKGGAGRSAAKGVGLFGLGMGAISALGDAKNPALDRQNKTANFVNNIGFGLPGALGMETGDESASKSEKALAKVRAEMKRVVNAGGDVTEIWQRMAAEVGKGDGDLDRGHLNDLYDDLSRLDPKIDAVRKLMARGIRLDVNETATKTNLESIERAFTQMQRSAGGTMSSINTNMRLSMKAIGRNTKDGSSLAKDSLAKNFQLAAKAIRKSMKAGVIDTDDGLKRINELMTKRLAIYGITGKDAKRHIAGRDSSNKSYGGGGNEGGGQRNDTNFNPNARGGLYNIGDPRAAARDNVPMVLNGQPVMAAEGESVAVLNRHQRSGLDMLASRGGYSGLGDYIAKNNRAHHMARGGIIEAATGMVGDPQLAGVNEGAVKAALAVMRKFPGTDVTSGRAGRSLPSHHGAGNAVDLVNSNMDGSSDWIKRNMGRGLEEGIHNPNLSIEGGKTVSPSFWGSETWAGHIDHIHLAVIGAFKSLGIDVGSLGAGGGAAWENIKAPVAESAGMLGDIVQSVLDTVTAAANERGSEIAGAQGGGGGDIPAFSGAWTKVMGQISDTKGWNMNDWRWLVGKESGGRVSAQNPTSTAFGLGQLLDMNWPKYGGGPGSDGNEQIRAMAAYISDRYGTPTAARTFWESHNFYGKGGILNAADGVSLPDRDAPLPDTPAETLPGDKTRPKKKKKSKKDAKDKARKADPFTGSGRKLPNLSKIKGKVKKGIGAKELPGWLKDLKIPPGEEEFDLIPHWEVRIEEYIEEISAAIHNKEGLFGLTGVPRSPDEALITLYDSDQYADFTNHMKAHPELMRGEKDLEAYIEKYGDSIDVYNRDGMNVQGEFFPGANAGLDQIKQILQMHVGNSDPAWVQSMLGMDTSMPHAFGGMVNSPTHNLMGELLRNLGFTGFTVPAGLHGPHDQVKSTIRQLKKSYIRNYDAYGEDDKQRKKLMRRGYTWQERVADNDARVNAIDNWLGDLKVDGTNHRLTKEAKKNKAMMEERRRKMQNESGWLKDRQPRPILDPPKKPVLKGKSKKAKARYEQEMQEYQAEMADYKQRVRERDAKYRDLTQDMLTNKSRMNWIGGGTGAYNPKDLSGVAGQWTERLSGIEERQGVSRSAMRDLQLSAIPEEKLAIATLVKEQQALASGKLPNAPVNRGIIEADSGGDNSELNALLQEQLDEMRRQSSIDKAQFSTLAGSQAMVQGRLVGSFARGGPVDATGMALVHKGEFINPAPDGPFRTGMNSAPNAAAAPQVSLYVDGDIGPLMRNVRAMVDGRTVQVVNQTIGGRSRVLTAAPGSGR